MKKSGALISILPVPGTQSIDVGSVEVHWLTPNVTLNEQEIAEYLDAGDRAHASLIRAAARKAEFVRARYLIRRLCSYHGPLPKAESGAPSWPPGLKGSLSHKDGYIGVALLPSTVVLGLGVDAEDVTRMRPEFESRLCRAEESQLLDQIVKTEGLDRRLLLTVLFSFKESLFKCHFPLGGIMFYFHDAEVISLGNGRIAARLKLDTSPHTPAGFIAEGHYLERREDGRHFVLTSVLLKNS